MGVLWAARAIGFVLLGVAAVASATIAIEAGEPFTGRVVRVMDGDTIAVRASTRASSPCAISGSIRATLRMRGDSVDAGPSEATEFNRALVLGQTVRLEMDAQEKDAQGASSPTSTSGTSWSSAELIANGYAEVAVKPPNVMHEEMLKHLQRQARLLKVGRWRDSPYVGREPGSRRACAPLKQSASAGDPKSTPPGRRYGTADRPGAETARRVDLPHLASRQGARRTPAIAWSGSTTCRAARPTRRPSLIAAHERRRGAREDGTRAGPALRRPQPPGGR